MAARLPTTLRLAGSRLLAPSARFMSTGEFGSGKGGGAGGSVREAGGAFGKMEAANEEMYFKKLQALQLKRMRDHMEEEIDHHAKAIKEHEAAIERHKRKIKKLE